jgi:CxxC motif-containing protein (DUF1111 family)
VRTHLLAAAALALLSAASDTRASVLDEVAPGRTVRDAVPALAGGDGVTVSDASANAFGHALPTLTPAERRAFVVGNSFFKVNWVTAPSSTATRDGLGPLFNARSCSACHVRDGRSAPPEEGASERSGLLMRIGVHSDIGADVPHPIYGAQVQDSAILGARPEARVSIRSTSRKGQYGDGTRYELLAPEYALEDPAYGPLGEGLLLGPRTAPQLIGLGLLEAIPATAITDRADPDDRDRDGISGRANYVAASLGTGRILGRFGWKATQPDVESQASAAFLNDMGITSVTLRAEALTNAQREVIQFASGGSPEIDAKTFDQVVFYTRVLAVPSPRDAAEPRVARGRTAFDQFGCAKCHVPEWTTDDASDLAHCRERVIRPFTDLLLHDMGPELADEKRDGEAEPAEWRTPPLWGIGLIPIVNGHSRYLHDGRARDLAEAVLWHGGEATSARERFRTSSADERAALLAFLQSL